MVFRLATGKNTKARETPDFTDLLLDTGLVASYNVTINREKSQEAGYEKLYKLRGTDQG